MKAFIFTLLLSLPAISQDRQKCVDFSGEYLHSQTKEKHIFQQKDCESLTTIKPEDESYSYYILDGQEEVIDLQDFPGAKLYLTSKIEDREISSEGYIAIGDKKLSEIKITLTLNDENNIDYHVRQSRQPDENGTLIRQ